jgi:hypothetical protein
MAAAIGFTEQHDRLVQKRAWNQLAGGEVLRPQRRVPSVAKEFHGASQSALIGRLLGRGAMIAPGRRGRK